MPNDRPEATAADYAAIVREQVDDVVAPVVVAHSGSGILLPAVAGALGASHQVCLAAWVPDPGASFREEISDHGNEAFDPGWIGKNPVVDDEAAVRFLFHDCDGKTLEWALSTRRLFLPPYDERVARNEAIPSIYVVASRDRTIRPDWQRRMARDRLGVTPIEIPSGHCPHVSRPRLLAEILLGSRIH